MGASASNIQVWKFGGTSVESAERLGLIAEKIKKERKKGTQLVVVVSAMGKTTDQLTQLAHEVTAHPTSREMDMLLTAGERISMSLLSMALQDRKVSARSFTGSQTGILTSGTHSNARIQKILGDRVRSSLEMGEVAIVAGFQGVDPSTKEITTLGRGGSDTTAVALAIALGASECKIYSDVDGVFDGPPPKKSGDSKDPKTISEIDYSTMAEYAYSGATIVDVRAVHLAWKYDLPIWVGHFDHEPSVDMKIGTRIRGGKSISKKESTQWNDSLDGKSESGPHSKAHSKKGSHPEPNEETEYLGVAAREGWALVSILMARPGAIGALWDKLKELNVNFLAPCFRDSNVWFYADASREEEMSKHFNTLIRDGFLVSVEFHQEIAPVTVVGRGLSQDASSVNEVTEILAREHISVIIGTASAQAIVLGVPKTRLNDSIDILHRELINHGNEQ